MGCAAEGERVHRPFRGWVASLACNLDGSYLLRHRGRAHLYKESIVDSAPVVES